MKKLKVSITVTLPEIGPFTRSIELGLNELETFGASMLLAAAGGSLNAQADLTITEVSA